MNRECLLVFGGGPLQLSIINNAKALGFFVIVIDPDPHAIGGNDANKFFQVEGDDFERTLQIAKEFNIKGIVTAATDKPLLMMARIAETLALNFPSYESILNTIDKARFKQILLENGLNCAKGYKYTLLDIPKAEKINYPVILKPTTNSGSRGVILCENQIDFEKATKEAFSESKGEILIEEFIVGNEISVEALVFENKVNILQITDKITTSPPYNVEIGQIQPSKYKNQYFHLIQAYLQKLIDSLKLNNCAIHPEFKVNKKGVFLLEMGPRLGGDFITSHLVPLSTGINMEKALIQIATNTSFNITETQKKASMVNYFTFPVGTLVKKNLNADNYYSRYSNLKLLETTLIKGDIVPQITNSLNRYGHFIIASENIDGILKMTKEISENIYNETIK